MAARFPENEEVLAALRVLAQREKQIFDEVRALRAEVAALRSSSSGPAAPAVASEAELDADGGDRDIRKDPKQWKGAPTAPCRMSEASAEYLDVYAEFLQWKSENPREGKEKYARYDARDARLARGWSARKRRAPRPPEAPGDSGYVDEL